MRACVAVALVIASALAQAQDHIRDVIYLKQNGCAYTMDVFKPKVPNHKAIVWITSFVWDTNGYFISDEMAKHFTDRGFTYFAVVHGSEPNFTIPDMIPMVTTAVRFVRANATTYDIDPNAIGVGGADSGAHLALEVGGLGDSGQPDAGNIVDKASSRANAVVAISPPVDFENWGAKGVALLDAPYWAQFIGAFGPTDQVRRASFKEIAHDVSPLRLVARNFSPTLLISGDDDAFIPLQQSQKMDSALASAKAVHKLLIIKGVGDDEEKIFDQGLPEALDWFDSHLTVGK